MDMPPSRSPGDLLAGKYRLERPLGEGGQATVWEAHNVALDARVALKLVHPQADDLGQAERLLREARAVARLRHPAVVRVFDVARTGDDGDWFIVMELLDGDSLADKLEGRRRLAATEAVRLLLPVAEALAAAHAAGIVHRDVKPDNIVLAGAGKHVEPKLLDFGIAKLRRGADWKRTTAKGVLMGTPAYLSPEQAEAAGPIDHRSDIWSFTATLYECVTGALPFEGDTERELLASVMTGEPRSILAHSAGDAELWSLLERGLKKDPEERWQSMQLLGAGLARWLLAHGVTEDARGVSLERSWLAPTLPPTRVSPRSPAHHTTHRTPPAAPKVARWTALGAGVAVVALLGVASMLARPAPAAQPAQPVASGRAPVELVPQVVPVGTAPVVAPVGVVPAPPVRSEGAAASRSSELKKPALHARRATPAAAAPAPRSSSAPAGLRLMNPY
jgi:serine/threonine-protein kinase